MSSEDLDARVRSLEESRRDQETRLRALERFQQWFVGAAATIGFVFGLLSEAIKARLDL